jgi:hypothetical protein
MPPAVWQRLPLHLSLCPPATPAFQVPWRSPEGSLRIPCELEGRRLEDCDAAELCPGKRRSLSGKVMRWGMGKGTERERGTRGREKRGWIGGSGMRGARMVGRLRMTWEGSR